MKMIAHRGYSKYELENTKEAFLAAANRSYFGIETDITLLKDRSMVLFHDDDLKRLANMIEIFELGNDSSLKVECLCKVGEFEQRGFSNELIGGSINVRHNNNLLLYQLSK